MLLNWWCFLGIPDNVDWVDVDVDADESFLALRLHYPVVHAPSAPVSSEGIFDRANEECRAPDKTFSKGFGKCPVVWKPVGGEDETGM